MMYRLRQEYDLLKGRFLRSSELRPVVGDDPYYGRIQQQIVTYSK